jgi:hypothetical protein
VNSYGRAMCELAMQQARMRAAGTIVPEYRPPDPAVIEELRTEGRAPSCPLSELPNPHDD